jgi:hypothetical protein
MGILRTSPRQRVLRSSRFEMRHLAGPGDVGAGPVLLTTSRASREAADGVRQPPDAVHTRAISVPWHTGGLQASGSDGARATTTSQPHPAASQRYLGAAGPSAPHTHS